MALARALWSAPRARGDVARRARTSEEDPDVSRRANVPSTPLRLLGRTVKVDHVLAGRDDDALRRLAVDVVAAESGADADSVARGMERVRALVPGLGEREARGEVAAATTARLAVDLPRTTARLMGWRRYFGGVDVGGMCAREPGLLLMSDAEARDAEARASGTRRRFAEVGLDADAVFAAIPSLLTAPDEEFEVVARRLMGLREMMPGADVAKIVQEKPWTCLHEPSYRSAERAVSALRVAMPADCKIDLMLTDFPSLLFVDIDVLLDDLRNTFGGDPCDTLRRNPAVSYQFEKNTAKASPLGPGANTMQADEENYGFTRTGSLGVD